MTSIGILSHSSLFTERKKKGLKLRQNDEKGEKMKFNKKTQKIIALESLAMGKDPSATECHLP